MDQTKTDRAAVPVGEQLDPEVNLFRAKFEQRSPLDELVREAAWRMLKLAIDVEVESFISLHNDRHDEHERQQVVQELSLVNES